MAYVSGPATPDGDDESAIRALVDRYRSAATAGDHTALEAIWAPVLGDMAGADAGARPPQSNAPDVHASFFPPALRHGDGPGERLAGDIYVLGHSAWALMVERVRGEEAPARVIYHAVRLAEGWRLTARIEVRASGQEPTQESGPDDDASGGDEDEAGVRRVLGAYTAARARPDWVAGTRLWAHTSWAFQATFVADVLDGRAGGPTAVTARGFPAIEGMQAAAWTRAPDLRVHRRVSRVWSLGTIAWAAMTEHSADGDNTGGPGRAKAWTIHQLFFFPEVGWRFAAEIRLPGLASKAEGISVTTAPPTDRRHAEGVPTGRGEAAAGAATAEALARVPPDDLALNVPVVSGVVDRPTAPTGIAALGPLAAALFFAAVPVWLVVRDRWWRLPKVGQFFRELWCSIPFFCKLALPPYFAVIVLCVAGLWAWWLLRPRPEHDILRPSPPTRPRATDFMGRSQLTIANAALLAACAVALGTLTASLIRKALPGWTLAAALAIYALGWLLVDVPVSRFVRSLRNSWKWLVALVVVHVALVALLYCLFSPHQSLMRCAMLGLGGLTAAGYLIVRRKGPAIVWIASGALVLFTLNIDAWWFSSIGDEFGFYRYAREIAEKQSLAFIGSKLFWGQAVFGTHPYLSSLIQAAFMKVFGVFNFGWRFSNLYLAAAAVVLFYIFFSTFVRRNVALLAAGLLACSHYIMSFGKIGYNNLQAFFAMGLVLCAASFAVRTGRDTAYATVGLAIGLCFYVYPAALYVVPLPLLLLLLYRPPLDGRALRGWSVLAVSAALVLWPLVLQPEYWRNKLSGTIYFNPQIVSSVDRTEFHFLSNIVYALFSYLYVPEETHFVAISYVDPLTAVFVTIGIAWFVRRTWVSRFGLFVMGAFLLLLVLVGASHDRRFPPTTRMFVLLPWFALFAATGLAWVGEQVRRITLAQSLAPGVLGGILAAILAINLVQAYPVSRERMAGRYQSPQVLLLRTVEQIARRDRGRVDAIIVLNDPEKLNIDSQRELIELYSLPVARSRMEEVRAEGGEIPASAQEHVADPRTLVMINTWLNEPVRTELSMAVARLGKRPCSIRNTIGEERFQLWSAPALAWPCEGASTR